MVDRDTHLPVRASPLETPLLPELLRAEVDAARDYAAASRSPATRRAYTSDWAIFAAWCDARGIEALPAVPGAVATFLASQADAGVKTSTLGRRLAAIGWMHKENGLDPPQARVGAQAIRDVLGGIRRTHGVRKEKKRAADADLLRDMLRTIEGNEPRAVRDRALLAIGMAGAFRRSELVALQLDEVAMVPKGIRILIGRSKTDQEGGGRRDRHS